MKIRTGFVSNSSSSSFVILGINLNKENNKVLYDGIKESFIAKHGDKGAQMIEDDDWDYREYVEKKLAEYFEKFNLEFISGSTYDLDNDMVGMIIADISSEDGYMDSSDTDIMEVINQLTEAQKSASLVGNLRIVTGTRSC